MCTVFQPLLGQIRMGLVRGTHPYQEIKSPHSLCQAYCLMWESISLFHNVYSFVLLKYMRQ